MPTKSHPKPTLEDTASVQITSPAMRDAALSLTSWLRANKLTPSHYGINRWKASCKGSGICFIVVGQNIWKQHDHWVVRLDLTHIEEYQSQLESQGLREHVWDNLHQCWHCSGCAPGIDMTILGRDFRDLCKTKILYFRDPDDTEVEAIEKLIALEKAARVAAR